MNRLVLVSNRLPLTLATYPDGVHIERSAGGLATGLSGPHERSGGIWIGWPGPLDVDTEAVRDSLEPRFTEMGIVPLYLSPSEIQRYYQVFANGIIWPLFHYLTGQVPLRVEGWAEYFAVNQRFADTVVQHSRPDDLIWVHDYQLLLVPALIRRQRPDARIGFFLHIPFPNSELFGTLPYREELLHGMLGADLIGFHTQAYCQHFAGTLQRILDIDIEKDRVHYEQRTVRLGVFPMGVDARALSERAAADSVSARVAELRTDTPGSLVLGIDRLDYTKGIPRRLLAFEELLTRYPEWRERVRLMQVAVPSRMGVRSYRRFREEVDGLVGRINGLFGTPHWVPVHYLYRSVPEDELLALYRAADVMLVTPVRDGMNLVAKEFAAARIDEDGVLVLSEFAGAAEQLKQALLVNPYDLEETADAYHQALTMSRAERRERMRALRATVFERDVHAWVRSFLVALAPDQAAALAAGQVSRKTRRRAAITEFSTDGLPANALEEWPGIARRLEQQRLVLFIDYDGTLTPIVPNPKNALLSGDVQTLIGRLQAFMPVVLVSGRSLEDLKTRVGVEGVIYAGSHGFDIAGPRGLRHQVALDLVPLLHDTALELRQATAHLSGVLVEEKKFSIAVHYRTVAHAEVGQVLAAIDAVVARHPRLEKRYGKKVIEVRPAVDWDKGAAVRWVIGTLDGAGAILPIYIGDDLTDEDAFGALGEEGLTIAVMAAGRPTIARYTLRNVHEVKTFLQRVRQQQESAARTGVPDSQN